MTREYLVVYEKGASNWSAFSPHVPGCSSLGDTLDETRAHNCGALRLYLSEPARAGARIPDFSATSVDSTELDPGHETEHCVVEWLSIPLRPSLTPTKATPAA